MPHVFGIFASVVSSGGGGGGFTPSDITDELDWVDCADTSSLTVASNVCSAAAGQMGNVTWSGGAGPHSGEHTINGKNVLDFGAAVGPGVQHSLKATGISYSTTGCHFWIVEQTVSFDVSIPVYMDGAAAARAAFFADATSRNVSMFASNYPNQASVAWDTNLHLRIANFASGGTSKTYIDSTEYAIGDPGSTSPTESVIGWDANGGASGGASTRVCAWGIGTSIMGASDRANLVTWAQSTWGTP